MFCSNAIKMDIIAIFDPPILSESITGNLLPSFILSKKAKLRGCDVTGSFRILHCHRYCLYSKYVLVNLSRKY